jgi:DNA-3-methyladenine glycosylase
VVNGSGTNIGRRWQREDYAASSVALAKKLLGRILVRVLDGELLAGRIVETEAYCGVRDAASHAYRGRRTERNEAMYDAPGTAYVYFTYGMHYCMNVVCAETGDPHAVLLRALEPLTGIETMRRLRGVHPGKARRALRIPPDRELCSGPARLCQALAITRTLNALDMAESDTLFIAEPAPGLALPRPREILRTPRIGIDYAGTWAKRPMRFLISGSGHVSRAPVVNGAPRPNPARRTRRPAPLRKKP